LVIVELEEIKMSIKIVDYQRKYAAGLAKMWNLSADDWGGFESVETGETVANEIEGSEELHHWVALDGDEVAGYCCFSEYREDEGASYIPLLNVRPDYHGKKVGKALVLKAVEQACQYPWPRLDLYTWPGNTKAVPLYKKCGFFWENRDDTTHLMNFIPHVMKTEAVAEFFQTADWYRDSVREIAVEPDGRRENEFEYLSYQWQRGESQLRMEFERRGRGLRLIETEDWLISATVEDMNLAFGEDYTVTYRLVNKTGKPLTVSIQGCADKNIAFDLNKTVDVQQEKVVEAKFHVGEISEEQNVWRTHPGVTANLLINGKAARFKVGVVPKFPALLKAVVPTTDSVAGSQGELFLNIENGYNEPASFNFTLPEADFIQLQRREYQITLAAREKRALPVPYSLLGPGLWTGTVKVAARPESGGRTEFARKVQAVFAGSGASFWGETDEDWFVVNGRFNLSLSKFNNVLETASLTKEPYATIFYRPQLGQPYSVEFAKTKPVQVEFGENAGETFLKALYRSETYAGVEIERRASVQADGLVRHSWTISNCGEKAVPDLWFRAMVRHSMAGAVLPLGNDVVQARDGYGEMITNYNLKKLQENWIFNPVGMGRGLCWPQEYKPVANYGMFCFDISLGELEPGEKRVIKPIYLSLGTFKNWREFRNFALKEQAEDMATTDSLELVANAHNPFVRGNYELKIKEHKNVPSLGSVSALSGQNSFTPCQEKIVDNEASFNLPAPAPDTADLVQVRVETENVELTRRVAVFGTGGCIAKNEGQQEGLDILTVDNGAVKFSAAASFGPALFSLVYQGQEWLDSSFPRPRAKSWWNPWLGGSRIEISGLADLSILKQPRTVQFVTREDNRGNKWQGIEIQVDVTENEKFKGLNFRHNILTLPGLAGLCMFVETEHTGLALTDVEFLNEVFLAPAGSVEKSWAEVETRQEGKLRIKQGSGSQSRRVNKILLGSANCPQHLLAVSASDLSSYINREVMICGSWDEFNLLSGKTIISRPLFFLFIQEDVDEAALEAVKKVRF